MCAEQRKIADGVIEQPALAPDVPQVVDDSSMVTRVVRRDAVLQMSKGWGLLLIQVAAASIAMAALLAWLHRPVSWWLESSVIDRSIWLGVTIAAGAAAYFAVLLVLGLRPSKLGMRPHA